MRKRTFRRPQKALVLLVLCNACSEQTASVRPSSISDYLGMPDTPAEAIQQQAEGEAKVARCMREAGFDYESFRPPLVMFEPDARPPREVKAQVGYRWVETADLTRKARQYKDPNDQVRSRLPVEDRTNFDLQIGTCRMKTLPQTGDATRQSEVASLGSKLASDERLRELDRQWSRCMRDSGYPVTSQEDLLRTYGIPLINSLTETPAASYDSARETALVEERELATADLACTPLAMETERKQIRDQYFSDFLEKKG
jgi:hypothetical protein